MPQAPSDGVGDDDGALGPALAVLGGLLKQATARRVRTSGRRS
jgi:hypothetical protein